MPLIILIVALSVLRFFEIGPFAALSWWWVAGLFVLAFVWFEYIEGMLGLNKRRAHDELDKARKKRVESSFRRK